MALGRYWGKHSHMSQFTKPFPVYSLPWKFFSASAWRTPIHPSRTHSDKNSVAFLWLPLPRIELVAPNLCVVTGAPAFTGLNSPGSSLDLRNLSFCLELGMHVGIWLHYWTACFNSYHDSISHTGKWRFRDSFTCPKSHSRHNIKRTQAHLSLWPLLSFVSASGALTIS